MVPAKADVARRVKLKNRFAGLLLLWVGFALAAYGQSPVPLRFIQSIPLPNVDGFLDHMGVDVQGQRLFVPTEVQKTVEVVDLRAGKVVHTITVLSNPHTVLYRAESNQLFVTDAKKGACEVFRGDSYQPVKTIKLAEGADNAAYDPVSQYFYMDIRGQFTKSPTSLLAIVDTKVFGACRTRTHYRSTARHDAENL